MTQRNAALRAQLAPARRAPRRFQREADRRRLGRTPKREGYGLGDLVRFLRGRKGR